MASIVNLQEHIGKVVGTRHLREETPMAVYQRLLDNSRRIRKPLPYPKGVFRFRTHEEAHEWKWNLMVKSSAKDIHPNSPLHSTSSQQVNVPHWLAKMLRCFGLDAEGK